MQLSTREQGIQPIFNQILFLRATKINGLKKVAHGVNSQQPKESQLVKILGIAAVLATIIALFFNGIFNTEVRQWFDNLFERDIPSTSKPEQN